ncbi:MAG: Gfo/Idh/MocA family oxidoreductase [Candidatus Omnitrophica bacterium]|nr:Gfo/Idh/MocA family oxidoreductase [Candidatus Omnitrophota bacterium]MBU1997382.1 Gfo/Idh/MocA family oxidoreductase [Candidatus Omnitrophota bacterium]
MLTVAQIGCGYWGPNLLRNLVAIDNYEVKYLVDNSADRRKFVNQLYPAIKVCDDLKIVLEDKSVDAVVIATPVATHFDIAMACLKAGKHILVEKPITRTVKELEVLEGIAKKNGLVVMVGHTFIYNAAVRYLKELIQSGELGDIRYIDSQRLNLGRVRNDVDALWNFAPHDVSIIQFLLNDPEPLSVTKTGMDYIQEGINDVVFMNIVYPNKIMANIHVSWLDPRKVRRMVVVGSKKMAVYDDISEYKIAIYDKGVDRLAVLGDNMDFDNPNVFKLSLRNGDLYLPKINFVEPLKVELSHFMDCIENKTECLTGIEHAKKVVSILESAS